MKKNTNTVILAAVVCNNTVIPACVNTVPPQADSLELQTVLASIDNVVKCEVTLTENRFDMEQNVVISSDPRAVFTGVADQSTMQHFRAYAWIDGQGKLCVDYTGNTQAGSNSAVKSAVSEGADYILEFHAATGQCTGLETYDEIGTDVSLGHNFCTYLSDLTAPDTDALIGAMVGLTVVYGHSDLSDDGEIGITDYLDSHVTIIAPEPCCTELPPAMPGGAELIDGGNDHGC